MLTRDFNATVQARMRADPAFGDALLREGIETMLSGDITAGKAILHHYTKANARGDAIEKTFTTLP
jgi:hypothetical protein